MLSLFCVFFFRVVSCWWVTLSCLLVYLSHVAGVDTKASFFRESVTGDIQQQKTFSEPKHCLFKHWEQSIRWNKGISKQHQQCKHMSILHKLLEMLQSAQQACFVRTPSGDHWTSVWFPATEQPLPNPWDCALLQLLQPCRFPSFQFYLAQTFTLSNPQAVGKKVA